MTVTGAAEAAAEAEVRGERLQAGNHAFVVSQTLVADENRRAGPEGGGKGKGGLMQAIGEAPATAASCRLTVEVIRRCLAGEGRISCPCH